MRRIFAQTRVELLLTLRRGESVLLTIAIPAIVLVFFTIVEILPREYHRAFVAPISFTGPPIGRPLGAVLLPGVIALAVIATGMVSLSIATAFERQQGVLKRLGSTPLGRGGLLGAKMLSTLALIALQVVVLGLVAVALVGSLPSLTPVAIAIVALGTATFTAIGFLLAGRLRAETNLAAANGLFLVFLFLGGVIVPVSELPEALAALARVLPAAPLSAALRAAMLDGTPASGDLMTLVGWTIVASALAARSFRWE